MVPVQTTTKDLGDSRVRVEAEVAADAVEGAVRDAAAQLGRDMKVDGFREGKVPPQVVLQQVGRTAVVDEAVRHALPEWYEEAVREAGIATVGSPDLDLDALPDKGTPLAFSFEVGVRPTATLGDYKGVEVARREPEVGDDEIQAEIDRLRESLASLETVQRAAASGDYVVLDFTGSIDGEVFEGGEARGFLLELGSGRLVEVEIGVAHGGEARIADGLLVPLGQGVADGLVDDGGAADLLQHDLRRDLALAEAVDLHVAAELDGRIADRALDGVGADLGLHAHARVAEILGGRLNGGHGGAAR